MNEQQLILLHGNKYRVNIAVIIHLSFTLIYFNLIFFLHSPGVPSTIMMFHKITAFPEPSSEYTSSVVTGYSHGRALIWTEVFKLFVC